MKIKKYSGYTTHEAMTKLKNDLGPDAIILNTRTIRQKGLLGIFKKPLIEITAAYEKKSFIPSKNQGNNNLNRINNELASLRNMVEQLTSHIQMNQNKFHTELNEYRDLLVENGVEYKIATTIVEMMHKQINFDNKDNLTIRKVMKEILMEYLGNVEPLNLENLHQKIIFFIGPTGVGKTTTLAKIAAKLVIKDTYDLGLVTYDTFRVAAVDQIKTYSDILKLPLEIIYNEEDMYRTLVMFKDKDAILVDTAGRNHRDIHENDEIFKIINSIKNKEVFLVLSCTTDYKTLSSVIDHYKFVEDYKIVFTKIDECASFGNILNTKFLTNNPASYVTTGQNVPDDIELLDKEKIVNSLLGEIKP